MPGRTVRSRLGVTVGRLGGGVGRVGWDGARGGVGRLGGGVGFGFKGGVGRGFRSCQQRGGAQGIPGQREQDERDDRNGERGAAPADAEREDGEGKAGDELADLNPGLFDADPADAFGVGDAFEEDPVGHSVGKGLGDAGQGGGHQQQPESVGHGHEQKGECGEDEDERHEREVGMPVGEAAQGGVADRGGAEAGGGEQTEVGFGDAELGDDRIARGAEAVEHDGPGGDGAEEDGEQTDARGLLVRVPAVVGHCSSPVAGMRQLSMLAGGGRRVVGCLRCDDATAVARHYGGRTGAGPTQPFDRRTKDR